jgi:hypothetical protein
VTAYVSSIYDVIAEYRIQIRSVTLTTLPMKKCRQWWMKNGPMWLCTVVGVVERSYEFSSGMCQFFKNRSCLTVLFYTGGLRTRGCLSNPNWKFRSSLRTKFQDALGPKEKSIRKIVISLIDPQERLWSEFERLTSWNEHGYSDLILFQKILKNRNKE